MNCKKYTTLCTVDNKENITKIYAKDNNEFVYNNSNALQRSPYCAAR